MRVAAVTNMREVWRTVAVCSESGPTMKPGVSTSDSSGTPNASHSCMKRADGSDKAARFMQLCDAFGVPLLSLVDTPGFMVGPDSEQTATVRHTSRMFVTAATLTVPFLCVIAGACSAPPAIACAPRP